MVLPRHLSLSDLLGARSNPPEASVTPILAENHDEPVVVVSKTADGNDLEMSLRNCQKLEREMARRQIEDPIALLMKQIVEDCKAQTANKLSPVDSQKPHGRATA